jgi:hypothetical protein
MKEDYRINKKDPDLKVLAEELTKQGLRFQKESYYESGKGFIETGLPDLYEASVRNLEKYGENSREGNYIKTPFTYGWNKNDVWKLKRALLDASNRSEKTYFELHDVSDQEWDEDRTWDASFTFFSLSKAG